MYNKDKLGLWQVISGSGLLIFLLLAVLIGFSLMLKPELKMIIVGLFGILAIVVIHWLSRLHQRIRRLEQQQQLGYSATDLSLQTIILYASVLVGLLGYVQQHMGWSVAAILGFGLCLIQVLYQLHIRVSRLEEHHILLAASTAAPQVDEQSQSFIATTPDWMQQSQVQEQRSVILSQETHTTSPYVTAPVQTVTAEPAWWQPFWNWMLHGNPILRVAVAVLMVGVILLLRFASEHWQLSLGIKLLFIAGAGAGLTAFGYYLGKRNALFAVTLQGVGLAVVFLTLVFVHHYAVIASLTVASACFAGLLVLSTVLSLKQDSLSLVILSLGMAYLAPLLIPQYHPDALFLFSYYLLINLAVALVNFIKPWKVLSYIAFSVSMLIGGTIIWMYAEDTQKWWLDLVLWLHIALFIWLSLRYSQLMLEQNQNASRLQPLLDVGLVFSVPVLGFSIHALLLHDSTCALTAGAAALAGIYSALTFWIKYQQSQLSLLAKSFFILAVAFFALIFPLAQGAHWTSIGWVVQGTALMVWGVSERDRLSLYSGMMLSLLSAVTLLSQIWTDPEFPLLSTSIYAVCQLIAAFYLLQKDAEQRAVCDTHMLGGLFLSLGLYAGSVAGVQGLDWQGQGLSPYLMIASALYALFYAWMQFFKSEVLWNLSQLWIHTLFLILFIVETLQQQLFSQLAWPNGLQQWSFLLAASLMSLLVMRAQPAQQNIVWIPFWASLVGLTLAMIGLAILPENPVIALGLAPLLYGIWLWKTQQKRWLQQPVIWLWSGLWLLWANLDVVAATHFYLLPLFNLTDLLTLGMMMGLIAVIYRQTFTNLQQEWRVKISIILLGLFVLSSVVVRALHHYLQTPLWSWAVWHDGTVQLSLTLLWVLLAFVLMTFSSRRVMRQVWFVGAALLGLVVAKLVLLDLAQSATLTRVFSFIGAGGVMLIIAYLAPLPPISGEPKV